MADDSVLIVHVASGDKAIGDQAEAQDHADRLRVPFESYIPGHTMWSITEDQLSLSPNVKDYGRTPEVRTIFTKTVDDFVRELQEFQRKRAEIAYLDFHVHGSPGALAFGGESFDIDDLGKLRNKGFEKLFAAGALISFLGCDIAAYDPSSNIQADGELFLAEFAHIFLKRNGGRAVGRSTPWTYRHLQVLLIGPMFSAWQNDGTVIVAEVAPGADRALLKGNYWLDEVRIRQRINSDRRYLEYRLQALRDQPTSQFEQLRQSYNGALREIEFAEANLRPASPVPYRSLHDAIVKIEDAENVLRKNGAPLDKWLF